MKPPGRLLCWSIAPEKSSPSSPGTTKAYCSRTPAIIDRLPAGSKAREVRRLLSGLRLNTVCSSALCPNIGECFHKGTATFLIMGPACTRSCRFCAVQKREPAPLEGQVVDVLVEGTSRHDEGVICGRTSTFAMVNFPGSEDLVGQTVPVRVTRGFTHSCRGELAV